MNDETIVIPGTVVIDLERNPGTVVNKVTASHGIRHGSSSASNDLERNPGTIEKRVAASHGIRQGSNSASNNLERSMKKSSNQSTVVNKVTASHDVCHGSSSASNDLETIITQCSVDVACSEKRGFQHVYKNSKKPSTKRVQEAYEQSVMNCLPRSKHAARRDKAKRRKLECLMELTPSPKHALSKAYLANSSPIFYSGTPVTDKQFIPTAHSIARTLYAIENLKIVDTCFGCILKSRSGDTVFTLLPRQRAIEKLTFVKETMKSLYALEATKGKAEVRGKSRIPVAECNGKYTTVGLKPNRGSKGITDSWPKQLSTLDRERIWKLMTACEEAGKGYLNSEALRGLRSAQSLVQWPKVEGAAANPLWGSLACGRNYYLNAHCDDDFFYSLTTIVSQYGLRQGIDRYEMDAEICNFFCFPEQGIAVALRPGDMLLFNPKYHHCLSSRTKEYKSNDVFCLSLYLKTAVVGGNDNSK